MATTTTDMRNKLAQRAASTEVERTEDGKLTIAGLINQQRNEIARALPRHMDADRLARIATTVIKTNPKLLECSAQSLLGALMLSAQTGMEPGPLGHAYFVPRWNSKDKVQECQWQLGYKGIIELARRSGQLISIEAREVCELDEFVYEYGLDEKLLHRPYMGGDRGPIVAVWGLAKFKDGGHYSLVMSRSDIDQAMQRSETGKRGFGPWITDFAAMARKTVIRRMAPFLPLSAEQANVLTHDETVNTRVAADLTAEPSEAGWVDVDSYEAPAPSLAAVPPADENGEPIEGGPDEGPADGGSVDGVEPVRDDESAPALPDDPMTDAQSKAVHALLRSKLEATGPSRFPHLTRILGREITSTKEISKHEAGIVIEHLQELGGDDAA